MSFFLEAAGPAAYAMVEMGAERYKVKPKLDLDACEAAIMQMPPVNCPVTHSFVPGFYVRTIFMPKGTIIASRIHDTRNPYWITKGKVDVQIDGVTRALEAPFVGITEPGTRRLLYIHEDCEWTTFHENPTEERDIEKLETMLTRRHVNPIVGLDQAYLKNIHATMNDDQLSLEQAALSAGGKV